MIDRPCVVDTLFPDSELGGRQPWQHLPFPGEGGLLAAHFTSLRIQEFARIQQRVA